MARLTPRFSANRAVRQYTEQYYLPAAAAWRRRTANRCAEGLQAIEWIRNLEQNWGGVRFGAMRIETKGSCHAFEVEVHLNGLSPEAVRVELREARTVILLFADGASGEAPTRVEMKCGPKLVGAVGIYRYDATVSATRPSQDYTARAMPSRDGIAIPLECARILWQR